MWDCIANSEARNGRIPVLALIVKGIAIHGCSLADNRSVILTEVQITLVDPHLRIKTIKSIIPTNSCTLRIPNLRLGAHAKP